MYKLLLLFLLFSNICLSQKTSECERILSKELVINFDDKEGMTNFVNEVYSLSTCGLDSSDIEVLLIGPVLGTILISLMMESDTVLTYQVLYDKIIELLNSEEYKYKLEFLKVSNELSKRPADINKWKEDSLLLNKLLIPDELINNIFDYLTENSDPDKTYAEIFSDFEKTQSSIQEETHELEDIIYYPGNVDFEELLNESIELGKPLLLYFTGYNCVNARKMEHIVLSDISIRNQLKNDFYFVSLYVDDRDSLPQTEWKESVRNGKINKSIGNKHSDLQFKLVDNNFQPCFVIIDKNGVKMDEMEFTYSIEEFNVFLKRNK